MEIEQNVNANDIYNLPWVEKYRPKVLDDLISHENILKTLREFTKDNTFPNLIFYGPPGTGKTSTIKAYAKQIYKDGFQRNVLELNASDDRGINVVRQEIKSFAGSASLMISQQNKLPKLVILDEAENMTNVAQFALRRIIEKYHKNARFCLITNYISKIIPALVSRCTRFKFNLIPLQNARPKINLICRSQGLNIAQSGINAVFNLCDGDMRRIVNLLQSLSLNDREGSTEPISEQEVFTFTSHPSPDTMKNILEILLQEQFNSAYDKISDLKVQFGISLQTVLKQLHLMLVDDQMTDWMKSKLVIRLGEIEYRLSVGCDERVQLASLVGAFTEIKQQHRT